MLKHDEDRHSKIIFLSISIWDKLWKYMYVEKTMYVYFILQ